MQQKELAALAILILEVAQAIAPAQVIMEQEIIQVMRQDTILQIVVNIIETKIISISTPMVFRTIPTLILITLVILMTVLDTTRVIAADNFVGCIWRFQTKL